MDGADVVRVIMLCAGVLLAAACGKFAWIAWRDHDASRAYWLLSYGFAVTTPVIVALYRVGEPIIWPAVVCYTATLALGILGLRKAYTINVTEVRRRAARRARQERRHQ